MFVQHLEHRKLLFHGIIVSFIVTATIVFVIYYVSSERYFYFWDYGAYHAMAISVADDFRADPVLTLRRVYDSINDEYNLWFAVPLIPGLILFGESRLGYILSLALTYQLPYAMVVGAIGARLFPQTRKEIAFWITAFVFLITPIAWAPLLRGYPDVAAAFLIGLAVWLFLQDTELNSLWKVISIGVLCTLAMLVRRHYGYSVIAFIAGIMLWDFTLHLHTNLPLKEILTSLLLAFLRIGLLLLFIVFTLVILGRPFLIRVMNIDYSSLYVSYTSNPPAISQAYIEYFGIPFCLLAAIGFILTIRHPLKDRPMINFIGYMLITLVFLWVFYLRLAATHYTLHFTMPLVMGFTSMGIWMSRIQNKPFRLLSSLFLTIYLISNFLLSVFSINLPFSTTYFFSKPYPPLIRSDYREVTRLVEFMRQTVKPGDAVYVAASSFTMNEDILRKAERSLFTDSKLNIMFVPQVDSRDSLPLDDLLQADFVIVCDPFQYSLRDPGEQKVVSVVYEIFMQDWQIAKDFKKLPIEYHLMNDVTVYVFQRIHPTTPAVAITTYNRMIDYIKRQPGGQEDWIALLQNNKLSILRQSNNSYLINLSITPSIDISPDLILLYASKLDKKILIQGAIRTWNKDCGPIIISVKQIDRSGTIIQTSDKLFQWTQPEMEFQFNISPRNKHSNILLILDRSEKSLNAACSISFQLNKLTP
jgi:hypothetical protein